MNKVVAISRQYGSAGRLIGMKLAEKLGISCYDSSLLDRIAEKTGFDRKFIKESGEYTASGSWLLSALAGRDYNGHSIQDEIWNVQREVIIELAAKESCVVVGRNADYILNGKAKILSVFIHASEEARIQRVVNEYKEVTYNEDPRRRLRQMDKRRRAYCQLYTDVHWGEARFYDVCLDSSKFGIEACVDILTGCYNRL
ncbi:MAG: cytidylate kinase-like family protein [Lachnospiraceae bacterium]|nr:cytidylate kinase-like family protein [Lachnospiraceae bacterium]